MIEILNFLEVLEELKTKALQGQLEAIDIQKQINNLSDEFIQQELQMEFESENVFKDLSIYAPRNEV
jgi:hypothetical protein|tara:strand:+ start:3133 stop:3333 length:201 start_codon:yes stop_codon:yes gene_type:complete